MRGLGGDVGRLGMHEIDERVPVDERRHVMGERVAIDSEGAPCGNLVAESRREDLRAERLELLFEHARRAVGIAGFERVGAHELRAVAPMVDGGRLLRTHLGQAHGNAPFG